MARFSISSVRSLWTVKQQQKILHCTKASPHFLDFYCVNRKLPVVGVSRVAQEQNCSCSIDMFDCIHFFLLPFFAVHRFAPPPPPHGDGVARTTEEEAATPHLRCSSPFFLSRIQRVSPGQKLRTCYVQSFFWKHHQQIYQKG